MFIVSRSQSGTGWEHLDPITEKSWILRDDNRKVIFLKEITYTAPFSEFTFEKALKNISSFKEGDKKRNLQQFYQEGLKLLIQHREGKRPEQIAITMTSEEVITMTAEQVKKCLDKGQPLPKGDRLVILI